MNSKNLLIIFTLGLSVFASSCTLSTSRAARRDGREPAPAGSPSGDFKIKRPSSFDPVIAAYEDEVREKLYAEQFSWLEDAARKARDGKERMPGGSWKLNLFYIAVGGLNIDGADDGDWQRHLSFLRKWVAQQPQSITAKVGLAEALINYGWDARGTGFADKVTDEGWELFEQRLMEANQVLLDARESRKGCPHWYVSMLRLGQYVGAPPETFDRLFAEAVNFEPDYYYYYRVKSMYLLPRWHGQPGDWEKFASESARRVGGEKGDILFFLIYSQMISMHDLSFMKEHREAWPRLLAGFRALEKQFGESPTRLNEACLLAASSGDIGVAKELFKRIGDAPNFDIWRTAENFEMYRGWALNRANKV